MKIDTHVGLQNIHLVISTDKTIQGLGWGNILSEYLKCDKCLGISIEGYQYYINILKTVWTKSRGQVEVGEGGGIGWGGVEGEGENADNCNWIKIKINVNIEKINKLKK